MRLFRLFLASLFCLAIVAAVPAPARAADADVQTIWRLLDYVAVDYREAVADGKIINPLEYREMIEFSASVRERMGGLPDNPRKPALAAGAAELQSAIVAKAPPPQIAKLARTLASSLIAIYPVPLAPQKAPEMARAQQLYAANCASCHGVTGNGRGPAAPGMDPPPIDFTDRARAQERSVFALYQVIEQGLEGTAMGSFAHLPVEDRWTLAFQSGRFAFPSARAAAGERIWREDAAVRRMIPDLAALAAITPQALAARVGPEKAAALTAYLRGNPAAVTASNGDSLGLARERLGQSVAAYAAGDRDQARQLALSAYLDGFEPVEPVLSSRDAGLMVRIEEAMGGLRSAISQGRPVAEVRSRAEALNALFGEAEAAMSPNAASSASTFVAALVILLREGLEALLILVAMIAFLQKADRRDVLPYVHGGWVAALLAGVATWWAATRLITISGASREITEGAGSLLGAAVLLFVGIWMHGKAQADEWQRYIRESLGKALSKGSAWLLFGLAFIAVYREVFETILFYAALSADGNGPALAGGAAAATALLAVIAWAMFRFSRRLPITKFFNYSAILIAILAVVLTGKGVAALQEAGLIGLTPVPNGPRAAVLGIHPTVEVLAAQVAVLLILLLGFSSNHRRGRRLAEARS